MVIHTKIDRIVNKQENIRSFIQDNRIEQTKTKEIRIITTDLHNTYQTRATTPIDGIQKDNVAEIKIIQQYIIIIEDTSLDC